MVCNVKRTSIFVTHAAAATAAATASVTIAVCSSINAAAAKGM